MPLSDRTDRVIRAFERYVDARIEYELARRMLGTSPTTTELVRKQHESDVALVAVGAEIDDGSKGFL